MIKYIYKYVKAKTKLFSIFDWILISIAIVAIAIFAFLFFRKTTYITITLSVGEDSVIYGGWQDTGPKRWLANSFYKGQKQKNGLGKVQAEVLNIYEYDKTPSRKSVYLEVRLNTVYNRASNTYTYNGAPVLIGSIIKLNLDNVHAEGLVTEIKGFPNQSPKQIITINAQIKEENPVYTGSSGTSDYVANSLHNGDIVYDNNGNAMITVKNIRVTPAERSVTTIDGRVVKGLDPIRKDVFLTLDILSQKIDNNYYFLHDIPILIDQKIPINTPNLSVFATVTKFLNVNK